jgi:hypothetical protein
MSLVCFVRHVPSTLRLLAPGVSTQSTEQLPTPVPPADALTKIKTRPRKNYLDQVGPRIRSFIADVLSRNDAGNANWIHPTDYWEYAISFVLQPRIGSPRALEDGLVGL